MLCLGHPVDNVYFRAQWHHWDFSFDVESPPLKDASKCHRDGFKEVQGLTISSIATLQFYSPWLAPGDH